MLQKMSGRTSIHENGKSLIQVGNSYDFWIRNVEE